MANEARARSERVGAVTDALAKPLSLQRRARPGEAVIQTLLLFCSAVSILTTIGIAVILAEEAIGFFQRENINIVNFLTGTTWQPQVGEAGILTLASATITTSVIAMLVSIPIGLGAAIYLSEYATPRRRTALKPILEVLAGVPTVVYGYFAIQFVTPILRSFLPIPGIYNMLAPGIVMGFMIVPIVSSMSEDALSAVPRSLREASYGLGATRLETATRVVLPAALSGVVASFIVGMSRAVGETMIVALAAGAGPNFTFNPLEAAETMTGHIARISSGDVSYESVQYHSIFSVGLSLFVLTLVLNFISSIVVRRFREVYE